MAHFFNSDQYPINYEFTNQNIHQTDQNKYQTNTNPCSSRLVAGRLTDGVGRQALRMASELECSGVYLGSCRMGCILKGCLLFIDIMIAEVREGRCASSSFGSVLVLFAK